jgi:phosphocarrier protein
MKTIEYVITDPVGVHARPAGLLVKKAASYKSNIMLKNMETGKSADAKRIMSVMSLGVKQGNKIVSREKMRMRPAVGWRIS